MKTNFQIMSHDWVRINELFWCVTLHFHLKYSIVCTFSTYLHAAVAYLLPIHNTVAPSLFFSLSFSSSISILLPPGYEKGVCVRRAGLLVALRGNSTWSKDFSFSCEAAAREEPVTVYHHHFFLHSSCCVRLLFEKCFVVVASGVRQSIRMTITNWSNWTVDSI